MFNPGGGKNQRIDAELLRVDYSDHGFFGGIFRSGRILLVNQVIARMMRWLGGFVKLLGRTRIGLFLKIRARS